MRRAVVAAAVGGDRDREDVAARAAVAFGVVDEVGHPAERRGDPRHQALAIDEVGGGRAGRILEAQELPGRIVLVLPGVLTPVGDRRRMAGEVVGDRQWVAAPELLRRLLGATVAIGVGVGDLPGGIQLGDSPVVDSDEIVARRERRSEAAGAGSVRRVLVLGREARREGRFADDDFRRGDAREAPLRVVLVAHPPAVEVADGREPSGFVVLQLVGAPEGVDDAHEERGAVVLEAHLAAGRLAVLHRVGDRGQPSPEVEAHRGVPGIDQHVALRGLEKLGEDARRRLETVVALAAEELAPAAAVVELDVAVGQGAQTQAVAEVPARAERPGADRLVAIAAREGEVRGSDTSAAHREIDRAGGELARMEERPRDDVARAARGVSRRLLPQAGGDLPAHRAQRRLAAAQRLFAVDRRQLRHQRWRETGADGLTGEDLARLGGNGEGCPVTPHAAAGAPGGVLRRGAGVGARGAQVGDRHHDLRFVPVRAFVGRVRRQAAHHQAVVAEEGGLRQAAGEAGELARAVDRLAARAQANQVELHLGAEEPGQRHAHAEARRQLARRFRCSDLARRYAERREDRRSRALLRPGRHG